MLGLSFCLDATGRLGLSLSDLPTLYEGDYIDDRHCALLGWKKQHAKSLPPRFLLLLGLLALARREAASIRALSVRVREGGIVPLSEVRRLASFRRSASLDVMRRDLTNHLITQPDRGGCVRLVPLGPARGGEASLCLSLASDALGFAPEAEQALLRRLTEELDAGQTTRPIEPPGPEAQMPGRDDGAGAAPPSASSGALVPAPAAPARPRLIGRELELRQLHDLLRRAQGGERQLVFLSGDAGLGKTTLSAELSAQVLARGGVVLAQGHCLQQTERDAYLAILDALSSLLRQPAAAELPALLERHAPAWLLQFSYLLADADEERLRKLAIGTNAERMRRELAEVLALFSQRVPLVLILEDLHWADPATLDLLQYLALQRQEARLLILGLYRTNEEREGRSAAERLALELTGRGVASNIPLRPFAESEVADFLQQSFFQESQPPRELAAALLRRTGGSPLFLGGLLGELVGRGLLTAEGGRLHLAPEVGGARALPESLRALLLRRIESLPPDHVRALEAASLLGEVFCAAAVAAALQWEPPRVEELLAEQGRWRQIIVPDEDGVIRWPDGTVSGVYRFVHMLYQEILRERPPLPLRIAWHGRIASRLEAAYGAEVDTVASELAIHFEQARDSTGAVRHLRIAAANLARRYANREALAALTLAMSLVSELPRELRDRTEMDLLEQQGLLLEAMGDPGSVAILEQLLACARRLGDREREARALLLIADEIAWVDVARCGQLAEQAVVASQEASPAMRRAARGYLGYVRATRPKGWTLDDARACLEAFEGETGDSALVWFSRAVHIQYLRFEYQAAQEAAERGIALALHVGDVNQYLRLCFYLAGTFAVRFQFGAALDTYRQGAATAEANGNALWKAVCELEIALVYSQAGCWEIARPLCEPTLQLARSQPIMLRTLLQFSLIVQAAIHLAAGQGAEAVRCLQEIDPDGCLHADVQYTLRYLLCECWILLGEPERAEAEAGLLLAVAAPIPQRSMLALGWRARALVALAQGDPATAEEHIRVALDALRPEVPCMATLRVLEAATSIYDALGKRAEADVCNQRCLTELHRIADDLGHYEEVRRGFLRSPLVRKILERAGAATSGE